MRQRTHLLLGSAIAASLLAPSSPAQRPPAPAPPPPVSGPPTRLGPATTPTVDSTQSGQDFVMFLRGRIATHDGEPVPSNVLIERLCNNRVRQQVYASLHGEFSMQLGSRTDSAPEASAEPASPFGTTNNKDTIMGIPRRDLKNCELRASAFGFRAATINLLDLDTFGGSVDVGVIIVQRGKKPGGNTVSALPYKAPPTARKAFDKGVQAEKKGNLDDARKYLETSVQIYPSSANSWYQLGTVLQKQKQPDEARKAFTQAATIDSKFLPPFLSLASMAYQAENWPDVLALTNHIIDLDPLNPAATSSYILDLDPLNYVGAYFYNAMANYQLNKIDEAERRALKAEHLDMRPDFPRLHLLLAEIHARKSDFALAISELQTYLALIPNAPDADQAREQLAQLEKLNHPGP